MQVYFDSSALIKRALLEEESSGLIEAIDGWVIEQAVLFSSSLAWIEVTRAVRSRRDDEPPTEIVQLIENALAGIGECPITEQVSDVARRLGPSTLRSLDVIHLATAALLSADLICAYDKRLLVAASELGFRTISPGAGDSQL